MSKSYEKKTNLYDYLVDKGILESVIASVYNGLLKVKINRRKTSIYSILDDDSIKIILNPNPKKTKNIEVLFDVYNDNIVLYNEHDLSVVRKPVKLLPIDFNSCISIYNVISKPKLIQLLEYHLQLIVIDVVNSVFL